MEDSKKISLKKIAVDVRKGIIEGTFNAKSGHPGGSLSIADIMTYLYFSEMNLFFVEDWYFDDEFVFCNFVDISCRDAFPEVGRNGFFFQFLIFLNIF